MGQDISKEFFSKIPQRIKDELHLAHFELKRDLSQISKEAATIKDVALISFPHIREIVANLNSILENYCVNDKEKVVFGLRNVEESFFWKAFIKIICFKIDVEENTIKVARVLNLHQFWKLRASLLCEVKFKYNLISDGFEIVNHSDIDSEEEHPRATMDLSSQHDVDFPERFTFSTVLKRLTEVSENIDECMICMDNKIEVSLKCAHSFCAQCISKWNNGSHSCPICRDLIFSAEEFWEFVDIPSAKEMNKELLALAVGS
ncbi:RING finger protein 141 isoform X1 [Hydra vulgaris]|uniref:RING finger protein 141 isoform X1 n=1 Tax=Hydra vulgaris TaxID=6087 RepID=UPI001F5FE3BC|nr:RING finger protein 141 isoform X1 [Hydra vulgaris]